MSCSQALDDSMPGERIASIAKDRAALQAREAEIETARRGCSNRWGRGRH
ncbi:MAG: hypothetical protein ABR970_21130 [Roseiarcus sp.]